MKYYNFIKDRTATKQEVFENLKYGGLKLLCCNKFNKRVSQVAWCGNNQIEIITIENDKIYSHYFESFFYTDLSQLLLNKPNFFKNNTWWLGYIED